MSKISSDPTLSKRYLQWKLLLLSLVLMAFAGWKIYRDWDDRRQVLRPDKAPVFVAEGIPGREPGDRFNPDRAVREYSPLSEFAIVSAVDVDGILEGSELVLGVTIGDEARAYPINMLTGPSREILNDTLAETPIAATW